MSKARHESSAQSWSSSLRSLPYALLRVGLALQLLLPATLLAPRSAHAAKPAAAAKNNQDGKEEAAAISQIADEKNKAGDYAMCGELFQKAYRLDPSYLAYLFSAARCEQKAGQLDSAERDYRLFIARTPDGDKLAEKAKKYLDEILEERKKVAAPVETKPADTKPKETKPAEVVAPPVKVDAAGTPETVTKPAPAPKTPTSAWMATIGGAALAVAGVALLGGGMAQRSNLQADLTTQSDGGLITSTTPAAARDRESQYRTLIASGAVCLAIGAAATGLGVWWWNPPPTAAGEPAKSARLWVAPTLGGAQVGIQF